MGIFSMENAFFRTIGKMVDLVWINILTVVCSLPIITAGASITAMYYLLLRMADHDQGALTRGFFREFKANFKNATKVWLVLLVIAVVYAYNIYLLRAGIMDDYGVMKKVAWALIGIMVFFIVMIANYIFALMARYENTLKQTIKNAALLAFAFFPRSVCMVIIMLFPFALMTISDYFFWFWFLYGLAFPGYFIAMLMIAVMRKTQSIKGENNDMENV